MDPEGVESDFGLQGWIDTLRLNIWFLKQKQRERKYRKKHFPCCIVLIIYIYIETFIILPAFFFQIFTKSYKS